MELLIREPARLAAVAADPHLGREKPVDVLRSEAAEAVRAAASVEAGLRAFRHREFLRLAAREIGGFGTFEEVGRELAHLADACFEAAIGEASGFAVIAMGKHGGEELNFSSDVDVIYVCAGGDGDAQAGFADLAQRATARVAEPTEDGFCFRVDLRLRPEGGAGALVNSLDALEEYYETFGRPWERQAWIKARPCAGDAGVGAEAMARLQPFVWPRFLGPEAVDEIRALLARAQAGRRDRDDVKLGPGGIREVEFFAQALQLLHGGRTPIVRERTTLRALDRLLFAGLVSDREHRTLCDAYLFLRRLENRLQIEHGVQTHAIPAAPARRALLGRRLGFPSEAAFSQALEHHRGEVRALWRTLGVEGAAATVVDFSAVPFRDREAAAFQIELLRKKPLSPFAPSAAGPAAAVAPLLVEDLADCPDPDQALRHLVDFVGRRGSSSAVWRLLRENRAVGKLLVMLFGTSEFLAHRLVAHPELLDQLPGFGRAAPRRTREEMAGDLARRLGDAGGDAEGALGALRRFRQEEELRIGLYDIAGELDPPEVFAQLSALGDAIVGAALALVEPRPAAPLCVVALGKLGAGEIDYGSDLDLVFVHGGDDADDHDRAARAAQRLIAALAAYMDDGRLYEIDTRLRPSGRQGVLVTTIPALRAYHDAGAEVWERQSLVKARVVAGDAALAREVERARVEIAFLRPLPPDACADVARLRARIEAERASHRPGARDVKLGPGGLVEVELVVEWLQLAHGGADARLRPRGTREAITALGAAGLLDAATRDALLDAWTFLRRLESRLRIVQDRATSELCADSPVEVERLARRMGLRGDDAPARLLADLDATAARVRDIYRRTMG